MAKTVVTRTVSYNVISYPIGAKGYINSPLEICESGGLPNGVDYAIKDENVYSAPWIASEILQGAVDKWCEKLPKDKPVTIKITFQGVWEHFKLPGLLSVIRDKIREQEANNPSGITFDIVESTACRKNSSQNK